MTTSAEPFVLDLQLIEAEQVELAGGKGAQLGALTKIDGVRVPPGFCVTTLAFRRVLESSTQIGDNLRQLEQLPLDGADSIATVSADLRAAIEATALPDDLTAAINQALGAYGEATGFAVRSSATAEDSPTTSFAGQQDSYLNVVGSASIVDHIRRCWASLFTERAVAYRIRNGIDHRKMGMAVVVQQLVAAEAAGVLFSADPATSNRKVTAIEASFGLGEALVSGLVNPDRYNVRGDVVVEKVIGSKQRAIYAAEAGGTAEVPVDERQRSQPVLTDEQILRLARLGRRLEEHFGRPQDIEWCMTGDSLWVVQSRPITTLFPLPPVADDANHVYVSVGHQQMMTDAMKPLGLSVWQMTTLRPMAEAGGRLFVDVTQLLSSPTNREGLINALGTSDPLLGSALRTLAGRQDFLPASESDEQSPSIARLAETPIEADPALVTELVGLLQGSLASLKGEIGSKAGVELVDFILNDFPELRRVLSEPRSLQAIVAGMSATRWLNEHIEAWLGEKGAADTLAQSAPGNVTSEMGLALLDVADAIRPFPQVIAVLEQATDATFLERLEDVPGGREARAAIDAYLERYGMRCVGEIDITRPRWAERPQLLVPMILGNVKHFGPRAGAKRFEEGQRRAQAKEHELLERVRALADGEEKATETKAMIDRVRTYVGYREYPKYHMISRYFVYKQALLGECARLVRAGVFADVEDAFYLSLQELREVVVTGRADRALIDQRREEFRSYVGLAPPRVFTSDGEVITGSYDAGGVPAGALVGLGVSAGTVEGRARVILDMADADLEPDDILVTAYTDPSWTPLFVTVKALVTEVGGLMTHGAVIAREYGLPAVVGVEGATRSIPDGQRIRVHGSEGYIELLG